MTDLADFLLARITEDESAIARYVDRARMENQGALEPRWTTSRLLAECDAKRRIVRTYQSHAVMSDAASRERADELEHVLRFLALPYSDHPDYDESWRR